MAALVDGQAEPPRHRSLGDVPSFVGDDAARIFELAGRSTSTPETSLALIIHPAGTTSRAHHHTIAVEVYFVRDGAGRLQIDGNRLDLAPGDTVIIRPGQVHKLWSDGPADLELLVGCTPAYDPAEVVWDE